MLAGVLVLAGVACGGDDDDDGGGGGGTATVSNGEVTLVAEDSKWDVETIEGPAGEPFTITVDNRDDGVAHNLHIQELPDEDLKTKTETGPKEQELEVDVAEAGEYPYVCDVHPGTMKGELVLTEATGADG